MPPDMMALLLAFAASDFAPPPESLAGELRAAIWHDLGVNAMIGNGNWIASLWYRAGSEDAGDLHIEELACRGLDAARECRFNLLRDGGVKEVSRDVPAPDRLTCTARLVRHADAWAVEHAPVRAGHGQTSMHCTVGKE